MEVFRIEDGLGVGPFSNGQDISYPYKWGKYLPHADETWPVDRYPEAKGWIYGCLYPDNIRAMPRDEAALLSEARYYLNVYEVPDRDILHAASGRQVSFRKAAATLMRRLILHEYVSHFREVVAVN